MNTRLLTQNALHLDLTAPVPAGAQIVHGTPAAAMSEWNDLAGITAGIWEMSEGTVEDVETDEVFVVLSGRGLLTFDDGQQIMLTPGTVVWLRQGERTQWTVTSRLRKVYFGVRREASPSGHRC